MSYSAFSVASFTPSSTPPAQFFAPGESFATVAALRAVGTTNLTPGAAIVQKILGVPGVLTAGTHADSPATGFVRPTDYASSTNEKYWDFSGAVVA